MKKPKIAITTYGTLVHEKFNLPKEYVEAIIDAGGIPYLLPPSDLSAVEVIDGMDAVILTGGGDLHPSLYGGQHHETMYNFDSVRDTFELEIAEHAIQQQIPCLGICRGSQVINVALGGTLYEHLPDYLGDTVKHRAQPRNPILHNVTLNRQSRLFQIMGEEQFSVSSYHHQGIKQLAKDLTAVAHSPDQLIEAYELSSHPWLIGVQWHPEHSLDDIPIHRRLFENLVNFLQKD